MQINLYIIIDKVATSLVGGIHMHRHDAPAVRFFTDVASMADSQIARHPHDFALYRIGTVDNDTGELTAETPALIIDGAAWVAAQRTEEIH